MLFTSFAFVGLVLVCLGLYYVAPRLLAEPEDRPRLRTVQTSLLVLTSFVFYAFNRPVLALLLLFSVLMNAVVAWLLVSARTSEVFKTRALAVGIVANLAVLACFKYAALFAEFLLPSALEGDVLPALRGIPLPIGISFYTFQGISLLVDVRRDTSGVAGQLRTLAAGSDGGEVRRRVRFLTEVALYISFFPQLIAGPIVRASQFLHQIRPRRASEVNWNAAGTALVGGYFLKMVVADNLAEHTALLVVDDFSRYTRVDLLLLVYGYSAQIFADFAGYSLIAIGLGRLFGYELPRNFRTPYNSTSITEFWQRWHISLSSWLREYLYIPLGGNRRGPRRTYVNLMIVMVLGGLWHGAEWNFAGWGLAHGLFLATERAVAGGRYGKPELVSNVARIPRIAVTFTVVSLLWLFFVTPDFGASAAFFSRLATAPLGLGQLGDGLSTGRLFAIVVFISPVLVHHVVSLLQDHRPRVPALGPAVRLGWPRIQTVALGVMLFLIATNHGVTGEFIYFEF